MNRKVKQLSPVEDYDKIDQKTYETIINYNRPLNDTYNMIKNAGFIDNKYYYNILYFMHDKIDDKIFEFLIKNIYEDDIYENMDYFVIYFCSSLIRFQIFLDNIYDINYQDENGKTILCKYIKIISVDKIKLLLERGSDQLIKDYMDRIPLHRCYESYDKFKLLVDNLKERGENLLEIFGMKCKNRYYDFNDTLSVTNRILDIGSYLSNFDVNFCKTIYEIDPELKTYELHVLNKISKKSFLAINSNSNDVRMFWINSGADINSYAVVEKSDGLKFIKTLFDNSNIEMREYLYKHVTSQILFIFLFNIQRNILDINEDEIIRVLEILDYPKFSYINNIYNRLFFKETGDKIVNSLYSIKVYSKYPNILSLLFDRDSINIFINKLSFNQIHTIDYEIFNLFFKLGMDSNLKNHEGISVVCIFIFVCNVEIVKLFLNNGCDLNMKSNTIDNKNETTPLEMLIKKEYNIYYNRNPIIRTKRLMKELLTEIYEKNYHLLKGKKDQTLKCLEDPITFELLVDPLIASDGNTYSRSTLEILFRNHNPISPLDRSRLVRINGNIGIPNLFVRSLLSKYAMGELAIY